MYRIALQLTPATATKPATYQFLTQNGSQPWETELEDEALSRYCKELDNYKRSLLTLVDVVDIKCSCTDAHLTDEEIEISEDALVIEENSDSKLVVKFDLCKAGITDYIVAYIDGDLKDELIRTLEGKGLSNINIHPCEGIQADQEAPFEDTLTLPAGLLRLYSLTTRRDNYISSAISKKTEPTDPTIVDVKTKEALDNAIADESIKEIKLDVDLTDDLNISRNDLVIDGKNKTLTGKINLAGNKLTVKNVTVKPAEQMAKNTSLVEVAGNNAVLDGVTIDGITTSETKNNSANPIFAIKVAGENTTVKNSKINGPAEGKVYSMVFVDKTATGKLTVEGNTFDNLDGARNVIEFNNGYKIPDGTVIKNNKFVGDIEHTAVTMMNFAPNAHVILENNEFAGGIRISNTAGTAATIDFKGGKTLRNSDDQGDWGYVLIQQVGSEDYSEMTINVDGLKKEDGTEYTNNSGKGKDLFCSLYSGTEGDHKIKPEKSPVILFAQGHADVMKARSAEETSYNKPVSEYQTDVAIAKDGKVTGTLLWATGIEGAAFTEGNALAVHINKENLPAGATDSNIEIGWSKSVKVALDTKEYNALMRIDTHKGDTLKLFMNGEMIYEYDLSGLVLTPQN